MNRRDAIVLRAFAGWTLYVWVTRIWNIWRDEARDVPFKAVHSILALVSVTFAVAAPVVVQRNRRTTAAEPEPQPDRVSA